MKKLALLAALAPWGCAAATLSVGPYLQNPREGQTEVRWITRGGPGISEVVLSSGGSEHRIAPVTLALAPADTGLTETVWLHRATVADLDPSALYRYRVVVDGLASPSADGVVLRTPGPGPFRFLALGDSGDGGPSQSQLAAQMTAAEASAALLLHLGDIAYDSGTFLQFEDYYFRPYAALMARLPFFAAPGNHDFAVRDGLAFRTLLGPPADGVPEQGRGLYYSFDWGDVHFVALDTNLSLTSAVAGVGRMLDWLDQDLRRTRRTFRVVYFHHPPYPTTRYKGDAHCALVAHTIAPILERHRVHLVLSGHEHNYQRQKTRRGETLTARGTAYVISGGGGGNLYALSPDPSLAAAAMRTHYLTADVQDSSLRLRAVALGGEILDDVTLSAAPEFSADGVRDAASFSRHIARGAWFTIFGEDLATGDAVAPPGRLPNSLDSVRLTANGRPVPLLYAGRGQINAVMPLEAAGRVTLRLETPRGAVQAEIGVLETAPAVFQVPRPDGAVPAVIHASGALVDAAHPAVAGEWLSVFVTGLGEMDADLPAGEPAPPATLVRTRAAVRVRIDQSDADVSFAGLAPGSIALGQVNFRVPPTAAPGPRVLSLTAGGSSAEPVPIPLQ